VPKPSTAPEIPDFLAHLPTHRGLPVPFSQAWFDGKPDFRTIDPDKTILCVLKTLCAICGRRLGERSYFICRGTVQGKSFLHRPADARKVRGVRSSGLPFRFRQETGIQRPAANDKGTGNGLNAAARTNVYFGGSDEKRRRFVFRHDRSILIQEGVGREETVRMSQNEEVFTAEERRELAVKAVNRLTNC
jgi:hypothetical protein